MRVFEGGAALSWWYRLRGGRLCRLPDHGRVYVLSDLHGHVGDFDAILRDCQWTSRVDRGEDLYLLLLGDAGDLERHRFYDPSVPADGDTSLFDRLIDLRRHYGRRVIYIEGNHDFHVLRIFREIRVFAGGEHPSRDAIEAYAQEYRRRYGDFAFRINFEPYDFVWRAQPRHLKFMSRSSIAAVGRRGLICIHAGPPRRHSGRTGGFWLDRLARDACLAAPARRLIQSVYYQILNNRFPSDYTIDDLSAFMAKLGGSLVLSGHSPLTQFSGLGGAPIPGCAFHGGLVAIGGRQAVVGTSYGSFPDQKAYVSLDLSKTYQGVLDLTPGVDIIAVPSRSKPRSPLDDSSDALMPSMVEVFSEPPVAVHEAQNPKAQSSEAGEGRARIEDIPPER